MLFVLRIGELIIIYIVFNYQINNWIMFILNLLFLSRLLFISYSGW